MIVWMALLVGCGGKDKDPAPPGDNVVDCLGMAPAQVSGAPEGTTRMLVSGDLDIIPGANDPFSNKLADGHRCWFQFTGPFEGTVEKVGFDTINSGLLALNLGGVAYLMMDGDITFDPGSRRAKASGTYDGTFEPISEQGEPLRVRGRFDYCHLPTEADCPYKIEGQLDFPFTVSSPKLGQSIPGEATDCRVIVDSNTGSTQLDMQIGVYRGVNLGQLFDNCVDVLDFLDYELINDNRLRYRTGGVTGAGTFGPYVSQAWDDGSGGTEVLPELEWKMPPSFVYMYTGAAETTSVCHFLLQSGCDGFPCDGSYVRTQPDLSQCTLTLSEPDHVNLSCEDTVSMVPNLPPLFEEGDFELDATCRIVYR